MIQEGLEGSNVETGGCHPGALHWCRRRRWRFFFRRKTGEGFEQQGQPGPDARREGGQPPAGDNLAALLRDLAEPRQQCRVAAVQGEVCGVPQVPKGAVGLQEPITLMSGTS